MPPATVATVEVVATLARVGACVGACVGAHAGSASHARYRGARTREQPSRTAEVPSVVATKLDPRPRGDGSSKRAKTRDRGAAQFMRMK